MPHVKPSFLLLGPALGIANRGPHCFTHDAHLTGYSQCTEVVDQIRKRLQLALNADHREAFD